MPRPNNARNLSKLLRPSCTISPAIRPLHTFRATLSPFIQCTQIIKSPLNFRIGPLRSFSASRSSPKGLSPESADPAPKEAEKSYNTVSAPVDISIEEFHELADTYLDVLIEKLEVLQEEREEVDVEYSAGVLTLAFPPNGTYVINKQPPNKQIWLSSPLTGPKRYDYVMLSEGQDAKEGTGRGEWVYLRDGSTLTGVLEDEIGIAVNDS
ncbi:hypothetical protein QTJ16_003589 [Diplocarpon rosae]|uniref:ferroxidase n=1 Tax=Diplocarpon rosae TaxID=946125 RepID=A0AAD9T006_9HELO|nr:hypothetical protein QTJ16_003589 [Diplocarpon rosae]PBP23701.1 hypothetical protein BUE80_DR005420 [Diplocarpon rosae]